MNVRPRRSAALPPLNASDPEHWRDYWRIFASYLEMALATEGDLLHPLSPLVSMVVDSQSSTLEVQRLVLGVVVEAVLNVAYVRWPSVAMPPSDEVEVLRLLIKDAAAQPALKRRVSTFIDGVRSPRAKDRLREIMAAGLIYERHLRAWDRVRNTSAHGAWSREILSQESIDELWTALNLFHRLVLNATGYSGRHTDYSQSGFPVADVRCVGPFWDRSELNDATGQRLIDE